MSSTAQRNTVLITQPMLSEHFRQRLPSAIRSAQLEFMKRTDGVQAVNVAIGDVSLPMHPAMVRRLHALRGAGSPFRHGSVRYTPSVGTEEARRAFLHVLASSGLPTEGLLAQITDGASQAMELMILGVCGAPGSGERPLLVIDPIYTNYTAMAQRTGRSVVSLSRTLSPEGRYSLPDTAAVEELLLRARPGALLVIPYDNPTGQLYSREQLAELGRLCVRHNLWMVSDEAYRELYYPDAVRGTPGQTPGEGSEEARGATRRGRPGAALTVPPARDAAVSIWGIGETEVPGITGRRISVESSSKVWNACGLRIGALITDNPSFHERSVAEYTANLCANAIGQYVFAGLLEESHASLRRWYRRQRDYYRVLMAELTVELQRLLPGVIVSAPEASIYSVVDVRALVPPAFEAAEFVRYCAREGAVQMGGKRCTLLVAPMSGFYVGQGSSNPGRTQMRIACVEPPEAMKTVPYLFSELLARYLRR
jgi:aspartate aminotransferase